jgi:hypothetical protein
VEDLSGKTQVYHQGSGGGQGMIFGFDWGAGDSFANLVVKALEPYQ